MISLLEIGVKPQSPKFKVGKKIKSVFKTQDGTKLSNGVIISNNTIDFVTLTALYDVEIENLDEQGQKIIIKNVVESFIK